jgi:hypothetical protein
MHGRERRSYSTRNVGAELVGHRPLFTFGTTQESKKIDPLHVFESEVRLSVNLTCTENLDDIRVANGLVEFCFVDEHAIGIVAIRTVQDPLDDEALRWAYPTPWSSQKDLRATTHR